jgi:hypothetical protein
MKAFNLLLPVEAVQQTGEIAVGINLSYHLLSWLKEKGIDMDNFMDHLSRVFLNVPYELRFFVTHKKDRYIPSRIMHKAGRCQISIEESWKSPLSVTIKNLKQVACFIGSRYHELVFCAGLGIPIIGIAIDDKIHSLFEELEFPDLSLDHNDILDSEIDGVMVDKIRYAINSKDLLYKKIGDLNERKAEMTSSLLGKCCLH